MRKTWLLALVVALACSGGPADAAVTSTATSAGPYVCNGSTTAFAVPFRFLDKSHLVVRKTTAAGVTSVLSIATDYSVAGAGTSSGTVTLTAGAKCPDGTLTIERVVPLTQPATLPTQGDYDARIHERAFDRGVMQVQQIGRGVSCAGDRLGTLEAGILSHEARLGPLEAAVALAAGPQGAPGVQGPPGAPSLRGEKPWFYGTIGANGCATTDINVPGAAANADCIVGGTVTALLVNGMATAATGRTTCNTWADHCTVTICAGTDALGYTGADTVVCRVFP